MTDVLTILLIWPLSWVVATMVVGRLFPKAGPLGSVLGMAAAVLVTTVLFGAPRGDAFAGALAADSSPPILSALLAWPILGTLVIVFTPRQWTSGIRSAASVWLWAGFVLSLYLLGPVIRQALAPSAEALAAATPLTRFAWQHVFAPFFGVYASESFSFAQAGYQFVEAVPWIESFGIQYKLGVDGISLWLIILTTLLAPLALDVSWNSVDTKVKEFAFAFLLLEVGMLGAFLALDLFLFYVFWELMLVPMYLIIGIWGGKDRVYAAVKFFIYTMIGSLLMLVAVLYLVMQFRAETGVLTFDLERLSFLMLPRSEQMVLFFAFALAFAIKVPMFPFHTWLPDAHVQAPTGGSVILAAVMLKLGGYGFIRFAIPLFSGAFVTPGREVALAPTLAVFAVIGIIYGAYCAWVQRDIKKLVAYSSVSHLGFVMLGLFSMTEGGVSGGILQMVSHGISTGALFILVGVIYDRRHTRDLADFGGLAKVMPVYATLFVIVAMSSVGLPGTNGFVGEFMILASTFVSPAFAMYQKILAIFAATGVILAAVYMLHAVLKTFWGPVTNDANRDLTDLTGREKWILAPLVVLVFWIGIVPSFFLNPMEASVERVVRTFGEHSRASGESRGLFEGSPDTSRAAEAQAQAPEQAARPSEEESAARRQPPAEGPQAARIPTAEPAPAPSRGPGVARPSDQGPRRLARLTQVALGGDR